MRSRRGFTLIELMVVVVIMAILAAVVVPSLLAKMDRRPPPPPPLEVEEARKPIEPPEGTPLTLADVDLRADVTLAHHVTNVQVRTTYTATVSGRIVVTNEGPDDRAYLDIAFPAGAQLARDVSLTLVDGEGNVFGREETRYGERGIRWQGKLGRGKEISGQLRYTVQGDTKLVLPLDTHGRARRLAITVTSPGLSPEWLSAAGLPATRVEPGLAEWGLANVVNDRAIILVPPVAQTPVARVILLCQLVGLAVLLFGAGFWYLSELQKPGRLANFRLGHFLFLALTYSTFFIIFAVLAFEGGPPPPAVLMAAAVSYPLLLLHVSRSIDWSFALSRVLPLALFTQAVVFVGVYGEGVRRLVFTGAVAFVIAFLTTTYRRFAQGRDAHEKEKAERAEATRREHELAAAITAATKPLDAADQLRRDAEQAAASGGENAALKRALAAMNDLATKLAAVRTHGSDHATRLREAAWLGGKANAVVDEVFRALDDFHRPPPPPPPKPAGEHCAACGVASPASRFCPTCGKARPIEFSCTRCQARYPIPVHVMSMKARNERLHCVACGEIGAAALV